jgi:polysaccharide biosynthesis transport protein
MNHDNNMMDQRESIMDQDSGEASLNLRHYWHIILERRWLVVATFLGVFALAIIYLVRAEPIYTAAAKLQIDREDQGFLSDGGIVVSGNHNEYLQTMYKNLMSRSLIEKVRSELGLDEDERYKKALDKNAAVSADITIKPLRLTYLVDIEVDHPDNVKAAAIANSLADNFRDDNLTRSLKKMSDGIESLKEQLKQLEQKSLQDTQAISDFLRKNGAALDKQMDTAIMAYQQATADFAKAEADAKIAQSLSEEVEKFLQEGKDLATIPSIAEDPNVLKLKQDLSVKQATLAGLLTRYKPKHPVVDQALQEIESLKASLFSKSKEVYNKIQYESRIAENKAIRLKEIQQERENQQLALQEARIEYDLLERKAELSKDLYQIVMSEQKKTEISQSYKSNNISIVDYAVPPASPSKPKKSLILLMGVVGGLAAGIGLAFFINFLDDSIKTQEDIENLLKLQFLGYIPNIKTNSLVERDLQSHLHPQSTAAESFRTLRTAVSLMPKSEQYSVISLTSTIPSEGKSLVASNLAIVLAQTGMKTVLVDADLRRPSVHKAFQLHSPIGLAAYLKREVEDIAEIIHKSEVPDLDIVCCGGIPGSPSELIGSSRMTQFISELRERYDRVIIDCPPVSAVSDPLVIAARTDGVIFVNKFNRIRREHARRTVQRIQDSGVRILGAVLNDIDFEGKDSYYYSYYYYQNRYYASHYSTEAQQGNNSSKKKAS